MKLQKISLLLVFSLSLQAKTVGESVSEQKRDIAQFISFNWFLNRGNSDITSLAGLDQVPNIELARALFLQGNNIEILEKDTFNSPKFENLLYLDLRYNNLKTIEPGAFNGLKNLQYLFLSNNQIDSLQPGALRGLKNLKIVTIGNNPNDTTLKKQAQRQLRKATILEGVTTRRIQAILAGIGIAVAIGVTAYAVGSQMQERERVKARAGTMGVTETPNVPFAAPEIVPVVPVSGPSQLVPVSEPVRQPTPAVSIPAGQSTYTEQQLIELAQGAKQKKSQKEKELEKKGAMDYNAAYGAAGFAELNLIDERSVEGLISLLETPHVDVNKNTTGGFPLIAAARQCDVRKMILLLASGANPDVTDTSGYTVLMRAIDKECSAEIVELLIRYNADVNIPSPRGVTPLMHASRRGDITIAQRLLNAGASVDAVDTYGYTALMEAAIYDDLNMVNLLLGAKADVTLKNNKGKTAFDLAKIDEVKKALEASLIPTTK